METLNLSESTPRTEGRLKTLFWPSIQNATDVDSLGTQGFWVCTFVAVISLVYLVATGQPIAGLATFLLFYLGGVGVRERSRYAAVAVFIAYAMEMFVTGFGIVRIIITALLLSNLRATWIAARWKPESDEAAPAPRFAETLADKFADQWPTWLWPKVRILYYIFSAGYLVLLVVGLMMIAGGIRK
jgi:hypothetical protein